MYTSKFMEQLETIIQNNDICRIERKNIEEYKKSGKPIIFNNNFLLIYYEYDFDFDGFEILKLSDITDIKYENIDVFIGNILRNENIMPTSYNLEDLNMDSFKNIFQYFFNANENIIIECEKISEFNIGKILKIYDDHIMFLNFDGEGTWYKDPLAIYYEDITLISFRNRYVKYMSKYVHND